MTAYRDGAVYTNVRPYNFPLDVVDSLIESGAAVDAMTHLLTHIRAFAETVAGVSDGVVRAVDLGRDIPVDYSADFRFLVATGLTTYTRVTGEDVQTGFSVDLLETLLARRRFTEGAGEPGVTFVRSVSLARATSESGGSPDAEAEWVSAIIEAIAESASATDAVTRSLALSRWMTAAAGVVDGTQRKLTHIRPIYSFTITTVGVVRQLLLPRTVGEAPGTGDAVGQAWTAGRTVDETAPAADTNDRAISLARSADEPLVESDMAVGALQDLARAIAESSGGEDAAVRAVGIARAVAESTAGLTADVERLVDIAREVGEAPGEPILVAYRGQAWIRTADAGEVTPVDTVTFLTLDLTLPPRVTITSVSGTRLSRLGGYDVVTVEFEFDQPVDAWVVRVGSSGPFDGDLASAYEGAQVTNGEAQVTAADLQGLDNQVSAYGRSLKGVWSIQD